MKTILIIAIFLISIVANALEVGEGVPNFKIKDQFGNEQLIKNDTKFILLPSDKATSEILTDYLASKPKGFLTEKKAYYLADISEMPSFVAKFFALPKMKDYSFLILLLSEDQAKFFNKKEDSITVYFFSAGKVSEIKYLKSAEELDAVLLDSNK